MSLLSYKRIMLKLVLSVLSGTNRARLLKRIKFFHAQGSNCRFYVLDFGTEPYLISFGNNVELASDVKLVTHNDAVSVFRKMTDYSIDDVGTIEIGDNVFVGTRAILLPNIKIGSNVIIGAGAIVNKDVCDGSIVAGVPARQIGKVDDWIEKRISVSRGYPWIDSGNSKKLRIKYFWEDEV